MVQVRGEDVDVFLKGGGALDINSVRKKPKVRANLDIMVSSFVYWAMPGPVQTLNSNQFMDSTLIQGLNP